MSRSRANTWLAAGILSVLLAAGAGYAIGSWSSSSSSEAESARQEGYDDAYRQTFAKFQTVAKSRGFATGVKRGRLAGAKTGSREGTDLGRGVTSLQVAQAEADAAEAARIAAEAETAERQANCGTIPEAPEICPTNAELSEYQAAVAAARQPKPGKQGQGDEGR